ncbi:MAG: electron transfer flavoprotein subunit beta/FixA family protein [Phycisphaerae bacterium]|nr:electron transfer flavoprotein subunit beta/FixA family protein [Phycisphaerae bacterium]
MGYHCVVCVKQVPDTKRITGQAMKEDGTVNRAALAMVFNPEDLNALEEALAIREAHGGSVTVVTMGLPAASEVLREALYRGADRVVLITDRRAAASDTLATSYILSRAVRKLNPDIVLCGRQAIDGDTAQVGPQLAQKLGVPQITYVEQILELAEGKTKVRRNVGNGWEVVACKLPVLMTVRDTANIPRPPAAKKMMRYKKARCPAEVAKLVEDTMPNGTDKAKAAETQQRCQALAQAGLLIEQWDLDNLEADLTWCGRDGSPTKVHRIQSVVLTGGEYREFPPNEQACTELISELIEDHTLG